jgi:hypothetical protein
MIAFARSAVVAPLSREWLQLRFLSAFEQALIVGFSSTRNRSSGGTALLDRVYPNP